MDLLPIYVLSCRNVLKPEIEILLDHELIPLDNLYWELNGEENVDRGTEGRRRTI